MAVKKETAAVDTGTEKKTAVKKTTARSSAKKAAAKSADGAEVKEAAPRKTAARKTAPKKEAAVLHEGPAVTVTVQYQNKDIVARQVLEKVKKAFAEANPDVEVKTVDIYIKPEEGAAYYAVNGEGSGDYKVIL